MSPRIWTVAGLPIGNTTWDVGAGNVLTLTRAVVVGSPLALTGAAGASKSMVFRTGAVSRWAINSSSTAESGADAGSNFSIEAFSDAGASLGLPLSIGRAAGSNLQVSRPLYMSASALLAGNLGQAALARHYFDGIGSNGDTYVVESAPNVLDHYAGGVLCLRLGPKPTAVAVTAAAIHAALVTLNLIT